MEITLQTARAVYNETGEVPTHVALLAIMDALGVPWDIHTREIFVNTGLNQRISEQIKIIFHQNPWLKVSYSDVERAILQNCKLASDSFPSSKF